MEKFKYLIPEESIDAIITNVAKLREIENSLRTIFSKNNYQEVLMPSFEYVDLYTQLDCGFDQEKMFQYINHEGKNVAMRCDFTIPLARFYSTNNFDNEEARYCYFGKVYRKEIMHKGRSSEFFQGGVELINKPGLAGDQECLMMIQESLPHLGLKNILIEIGSAQFFNRICYLVKDKAEELTEILKYRNISGMKRFVAQNNFSDSLNSLLLKLPVAFGDIRLLNEAIENISDPILIEAMQNLKEVYNTLDSKDKIIFDLGMVPSMKYYTGLMIKGYCDTSAQPIISGGRYDDLLPRFNKNVSAIGFCYHMNHILKALDKEDENND
ncbi:ATP phosphoribosyltransferase regulatory subunit [uncultured Thomasclavelia sp.]|uniref:ATP phosphoribosyltransferase regulatory subunit n=1 Tax=uncultured Thomasclavelia sp. TaxID=3025759 RepID=UPI0025F673A7|nr:ATP phosphoribosyltransferase regulatory subunit [uncultured Thomasclavelia sp.]